MHALSLIDTSVKQITIWAAAGIVLGAVAVDTAAVMEGAGHNQAAAWEAAEGILHNLAAAAAAAWEADHIHTAARIHHNYPFVVGDAQPLHLAELVGTS